MGALFSSPSPPPPPPAPVIHTPDPVDEERKARLKALERRRRGRAGLVATSEKGLDDAPGSTLGGGSSSATETRDGPAASGPPPQKTLKKKLGA